MKEDNPTKHIIQKNIEKSNNNQEICNNLDLSNNNFLILNHKKYNIIETEKEIYIENTNIYSAIKISRLNSSIICLINSKNKIPNVKQKLKADAIIGIFNLNNISYLGIVIDSKEIDTILDCKLYGINCIQLIKITNDNESEYNKNLKKNIVNFFMTKNFYYSNDYKLSLTYEQIENNEAINYK